MHETGGDALQHRAKQLTSMLFRVSLPNPNSDGTHGPVPVPGFGTQLNNRAIFGVPPEGTVTIDYTEGEFMTSDGVKVHLRTPSYKIEKRVSTVT